MIPYKNVDTLSISYKNGHPYMYLRGTGETEIPKTYTECVFEFFENALDALIDIMLGVRPDNIIPSRTETFDTRYVFPGMPGSNNMKTLKGQVKYAAFLKGKKLNLEFDNDVPDRIRRDVRKAYIDGRKTNNRIRVRELNEARRQEEERRQTIIDAQKNPAQFLR